MGADWYTPSLVVGWFYTKKELIKLLRKLGATGDLMKMNGTELQEIADGFELYVRIGYSSVHSRMEGSSQDELDDMATFYIGNTINLDDLDVALSKVEDKKKLLVAKWGNRFGPISMQILL
nr:hypothetical protein K-LCC10_0171 [Kaumoebavirus]